MYIDQALKSENTSIINLPDFREGANHNGKEKPYNRLINFFRLIKILPINLRRHAGFSLFKKEQKFDFVNDKKESDGAIRFEISSEKMNELLLQRQICAADIRCLDTNSKQCLKKLCLKTCLYKPKYNEPAPQLLGDFNRVDSQRKLEKYD